MNLFKKHPKTRDNSDASLVIASLGGDRNAFGNIVSRYQSLLCSIAYSAVGDLNHSEDIAQEAFVEAWKKLDSLREPEKLKSWLCGIVRFKVSHYRRKEASQPIKGAGDLDDLGEHEDGQVQIEEVAIQEQEQSLMWKTLEQLPENYREPLILFYRESCSVERVASELDISEDTAKQRLSRGRKLLQAAMLSFVEDALAKSKPGAGFTMAVMLAIGTIAPPPAKAAVIGVGALKAGSVFKWANLVTTLAAFSGLVSSFFALRASLDQSRTKRERIRSIKIVACFFLSAIAFVAGMFLLRFLAVGSAYVVHYTLASQLLVFGYVVFNMYLLITILLGTRKIRAQERKLYPEAFAGAVDNIAYKRREFRTRARLFGVPLAHFQFGMPEEGDKVAYGWIAVGERAYGLLFASGGIAVAPISVGILSIGFFSVGVVGIGLLATGTVALGVIGFGASTIAYKAYASMSALGWESAISGGFSVAKEAAIGQHAYAKYVNNEQAGEIANLAALNQSYLWVLVFMTLLIVLPAVWHSNQVRKRMSKKQQEE